MVDRGVQLVGIDYLSIGVFEDDGPETHQILLGAKVWILEGLNLGKINEGVYDFDSLSAPDRRVGRISRPGKLKTDPRGKT